MNKLRTLLGGGSASSHNGSAALQRHSVSVEPEVGFQITIELNSSGAAANGGEPDSHGLVAYTKASSAQPELNVHLIAARHLPALFGFKVVQGYLIKVKMFPGSKRLDSSIQTNSWPKFNENFRFPLTPDIKPSLKHSSRRCSKTTINPDFTPDEIFAGQFVVFTVYALLELPPASFNRLNKTYRSLRDKGSSFVQKVVESSSGPKTPAQGDKENAPAEGGPKTKRKSSEANPRDAMPPLTISESRRNIGSVTCYLEPKLFKRNGRSGLYSTEELWLPIKDLTSTVPPQGPANSLSNSPKGVVELVLEVAEVNTGEHIEDATHETNGASDKSTTRASLPPPPAQPPAPESTAPKNPQWNRMTSEVKRKMGISNTAKAGKHNLVLRITTSRMRCSNKVKDELEATAGSVYVKTTVFEHGIYIDCWKSANFYPSLSTRLDGGGSATVEVPLQSRESLENILVRTTLATKTKMGKKFVLGTVMVGAKSGMASGVEHMLALHETPLNERLPMWHSYQ